MKLLWQPAWIGCAKHREQHGVATRPARVAQLCSAGSRLSRLPV